MAGEGDTGAVLSGGFADPARASQAAFRALMAAFAEPGSVRRLRTLADPPEPLPPGVGTVILTLCDADTALWIDPAFGPLAPRWAAFQTGAPIVEARGEAAFAVAATADLRGLRTGSDTYPDRSATLILPVRFDGPALTLSGPGIDIDRTVHLDLPDDFAVRWDNNRALFPRGVDLVLVDGAAVMALPRTTRARTAVSADAGAGAVMGRTAEVG